MHLKCGIRSSSISTLTHEQEGHKKNFLVQTTNNPHATAGNKRPLLEDHKHMQVPSQGGIQTLENT